MFARLVNAVRLLFAPVPGAIRDHLNVEELARIGIVALTTGGVSALPAVLLSHIQTIVAPADITLATAVLTALCEVLRRLPHGKPPLLAS